MHRLAEQDQQDLVAWCWCWCFGFGTFVFVHITTGVSGWGVKKPTNIHTHTDDRTYDIDTQFTHTPVLPSSRTWDPDCIWLKRMDSRDRHPGESG